MFPHHEDEIAQSEAASGKPFVHYWMHCAHLVVDGRKMSKSLGNFFTLRDILSKGYSGREIRYVLISAHYRQSLNFSFDALDGAKASLARLDEFQERLRETAAVSPGSLPAWAETAGRQFREALDNDLGISEALAAIFDMVHEGNRAMDAGKPEGDPGAVLKLLAGMDDVLGFLVKPGEDISQEALALLKERTAARKAKNWAESDLIRDRLATLGWEVKDTPAGPKLKKRSE